MHRQGTAATLTTEVKRLKKLVTILNTDSCPVYISWFAYENDQAASLCEDFHEEDFPWRATEGCCSLTGKQGIAKSHTANCSEQRPEG